MICPHCGEKVEGRWIDEGIGEYEYWGHLENDSQMVFVCEECDGELEPDESYDSYVAGRKEEYMADKDYD